MTRSKRTHSELDRDIAEVLAAADPGEHLWFHASPDSNRASIQRHGLLMSKVYDDGMTPVGIYFTEHPPVPGVQVPSSYDVWAADLTGFERHPDPFCGEDQTLGDCVYVTRDVPSRHLRRNP